MYTRTTTEPGISSVDVGIVDTSYLVGIWPTLYAIMQDHPRFLEEWDAEEILHMAANPQIYQLWVCTDGMKIEAFCVTCIVRSSKISRLRIVALCGEKVIHKYLKRGMRKIEEFACIMECNEVRFTGREGWRRMFEKLGYRQVLEMRKDVRRLN